MKRFFTIATLLLSIVACNKNSGEGGNVATGVVLSMEKVDLMVGQTATITATVLPESLGMGVSWSVIDEEFAEVKDGVITAKAEGVTYVVAVSADGSKRAACLVSVNPEVKYTVSLKDELGRPVTAVYGYPGMSLGLQAFTSDGETTHTFTWSIEDEAAGSITDDGHLTLAAAESQDPAFVFDAESYLKVVTEEGFGCRIPVRSSMLKGVSVDGFHFYQPAGTNVTVQVDETHIVAALYQGATAPAAIPAEGVVLELSDHDNFSILQVSGEYVLATGSVSGVSTQMSARISGVSGSIELATFRIDKIYPIRAELVSTSSSTLVFTWTEGGSASDDTGKPYTIALYSDPGCTDEVLHYSIEADASCWGGRQPCFIFTGLEPGTTYWFKARDDWEDEDFVSEVISGTTDAFTIVEPGDDPADVGDVILAEDFSELYWMADEVTRAAGYDVGSNNSTTFQNRTVSSFVGSTGQYCNPERIITSQETARKASGLRLGKWAQGYTARLYVGPGYVFLSTYGYGTHLITPKLNNIPEDASATLQVTVHAAGYKSGYEAVLAVQKSSVSFNAMNSGTKTNKDKLNLTENAKTITYTGGLTTLGEFTVTLEGVRKGDRIAFGPTETAVTVSGSAQYVKSNANMMLISDMTVTIVDIVNE